MTYLQHLNLTLQKMPARNHIQFAESLYSLLSPITEELDEDPIKLGEITELKAPEIKIKLLLKH